MKMFNTLFVLTVSSFSSALYAQDISVIEENGLRVHVYNAAPESFSVTAVLIEGEKEAALINAFFSKEDAQNMVDLINRTGKNLTTIYVSHHDPDFYFGLGHIAENFPKAKIISTPQTAYLIDATKESKLEVWGTQLKENAPKRFIVPTAVDKNYFMLESTRIEIKQRKDDPDFSYLWIPSMRMILGGTYVYDRMHVWMADLQAGGAPDKWLRALDDMQKLDPEYVIPGHCVLKTTNMHGVSSIRFTREYILQYEKERKKAADSGQLISAMKALYPGLAGDAILELGAKVRKGEMEWKKTDSFPLIARKAEVRFGNNVFELDFKDNRHMSFIGKAGDMKGFIDSVEYTAIEIAPRIYMVYWSEPVLKSNVVHVEDFNSGVVYTNFNDKDGNFINMKGTIRIIE